ncbi:M23 family metallopeptidase [Sphingomonas sp.]
MTRLGWAIAIVIVAGLALFASMVRFGPAPASQLVSLRTEAPPAPPPYVDPLAEQPGKVRWSGGLLTVPVAGVSRDAIASSWGDPRSGGRLHRGNDIMAARGTPVLAAADGTVEKLFESEAGGTTLYVRSPDGMWTYYYAHLAGYAPGMREGMAVRAGDLLGYVGDTGNAGVGNYHLHFGLYATRPDRGWWEGRAVDPTPLLAGLGSGR